MDKQQFLTHVEHAYDTKELKQESIFMFKLLQFKFDYDDEKKTCTISCPVTEVILNPSGIIHGGMYTFLADTAMGHLNFRHKDVPYVSLELKTSFFRAANAGHLFATSRYVKEGHNVSFMECDIKNETGELLCRTSGIFYRFDKKTRS